MLTYRLALTCGSDKSYDAASVNQAWLIPFSLAFHSHHALHGLPTAVGGIQSLILAMMSATQP